MNSGRISDRYEIKHLIGGGGMADVYLARDIILDRDVAVKVLKPQFSEDEEFIRRFRREAQAATSLTHPNVVSIYDVGEEDRLYYIVMEYIKGFTLKDYIQQKGKLHVHEAVNIMEQITSAIQHAHENHIIHRDIKPHNILIDKNGVAKVTDFGIARAISEATITHTNSIMGSVHYLSPEQARGGLLTYKSDIYSLGIVMYEMLAGEVPFHGDTAVSVAIKHLQDPLPFIRDRDPSIPQSVENVIIKATAKDPLNRYATAREMLEDLYTVFNPSRNAEKRLILHEEIVDGKTKVIPNLGDSFHGVDEHTKIVRPSNSVPMNDHKEDSNKNKKSKSFWILVSASIIFFIVGAMWIAFSLIPRFLHVDEVTIPDDFIGLSFEEVEETLTELDLKVKEERRYDDNIEEGFVISHKPEGGETVKVGTVVTVVVSDGIEPIEMEDVVGKSYEQAQRILRDFKEIEVVYRESINHEENIVLEQYPEVGDLVIPNETEVTITLSKRPTYVMDNLSGMRRDEVLTALASNPLLELVFDEDYHPTIEEGLVISQDPARGTEIREKTKVTVVFSQGPEPEPEEPEELPISVTVPFEIELTADNDEEELYYRIGISIVDMMHSTPSQIIDREINEKKYKFHVPMTVAPGSSGYLFLYINGEQHVNSPYEYTYEQLKAFR